MKYQKLYKLDINRNVLEWYIDIDYDKEYPTIVLYVGRYSGRKTHFVSSTTSPEQDMDRKIKDKLNNGWKYLSEFSLTEDDPYLEDKLSKLLPYEHMDINNLSKPQKAVLFKEGKIKYPAAIQPKLNGIRSNLRWGKVQHGEGLFAKYDEGAILTTMEGLVCVLPHITDILTEDDFIIHDQDGNQIDLIFDGELYRHGKKLNDINSSIPRITRQGTLTKPKGNPKDIQFWCYDLAIPNVPQAKRFVYKDTALFEFNKTYDPLQALNVTGIINVEEVIIANDKQAKEYKDYFINSGYEGAILRTLDHNYGFGKRNSNMMKLKQWYNTKCTILDVIEKSKSVINGKERTYIEVLLKNDINDESFECTPEGDETYRNKLLDDKNLLIGFVAQVRYRERTGVKQVPFQGKIIKIENYD